MYSEEALEEKIEAYKLIKKRAKQVGMIFGVLGGFMALIFIVLAFSIDSNIFMEIFIFILVCAVPFAYYGIGYLWYFGFLTAKSWFLKADIEVKGATTDESGSLVASYIISKKRAVKLNLVTCFIIFGITLLIGFYAGLFSCIKLHNEMKRCLVTT